MREKPPLASDPHADLSTNTTKHLVADIELLREHLAIDRWLVVGVSWGSTLALAYAQRHRDRVLAIVLAGVTTGTRRETTWITRDMGRIFPQQWAEFVALVPEPERDGDLATAYARLMANPNPRVRQEAARRWCQWEDTHVSLMPGWEHNERYDDAIFRLVFTTLVTHYWSHGCFLADRELITGIHRLADIPGILIHGRHDISGPLETAWHLHQAWPASDLVVVADAGHGGRSFGTELISAIDRFRNQPG